MRIGVVTTSYPRVADDPAGGFVSGFARWLSRRGHDVEVIAAGPGAARVDGIPVHRVRAGASLFYGEGAPDRFERDPLAFARAPLFSVALAARAAPLARRWDLVVSHWLVPSGVVAATLARGRPHLAIAHSGDVHLVARAPLADATVAALLASTGTRLVFAGEHLRRRLLSALRSPARRAALLARSSASPMGIDAAAFARARGGDRAVARAALGLPSQGPVVAFLGRLVPIKGVEVLIDAMARLRRTATLLVGGDGPARASLWARAREAGVDARFAGELRGSRRDALWAAADALAVPSVDRPGGRTEGTPTVVLEALAAGVPLVASRVDGLAALAAATPLERVATLVPPGDPGALAAAIAALLADPAAAARRAEAGRALASEFDWERVGPRLLAVHGLHKES